MRFCLVVGAVAAGLGVFYMNTGGPTIALVMVGLGVFVMSVLPALLWLGLSMRVWSVLLSVATLAVVIPFSISQDTPLAALPWLVVPLLMARTLGDTVSGYVSVIIALAGVSVYFLLDGLGLLPAPWLPVDTAAQTWGNLAGLYLAVLAIGDVAASSYEGAAARLRARHAELRREMEHHRRTQNELEDAHIRVVQTARVAGMAEIATGVLHNVGNALNTVGVTAQVVRSSVANTETIARLDRVAELVRTGEAKPDAVANFLHAMARKAERDCERLTADMERLAGAVEHVANVVSAQQAHARSRGVVETVRVDIIVNDVLPLTRPKLDLHRVKVEVSGDLSDTLTTERHQVVQILENLVRNAAEAMATTAGERMIHITVEGTDEMVCVRVRDTGPGVDRDDAEKVFQHGFTRKATGSGFGLHVSALACKALGGRLELEHARNPGACFAMWLPRAMPDPPAAPRPPVAERDEDKCAIAL